MKFTFLAAILSVLTGSRWGAAKAADHHDEGDADVDVDAGVSNRRAGIDIGILSNAQDDRRVLGSKSSKQQPKRIREKAPKSSKHQPKSSKADRELCIWDETAKFELEYIKMKVGLVIDSVNVAKLTLTDAQVVLVVPNGVLEKHPERILMISEMASELGVDESTFTFVEEEEFEVPDGDVVVVYLDCGESVKIVVYKNGQHQFEQGVLLGVTDDGGGGGCEGYGC